MKMSNFIILYIFIFYTYAAI